MVPYLKIRVVHQINRITNKTLSYHTIILINVEKAFGKSQPTFTVKILCVCILNRNRGALPELDKKHAQRITVNIANNVERLNACH